MKSRDADGKPATTMPIPVKLGTQSCSIYVHGDDPIEVGEIIRYKPTPWEPWTRWKTAYVHGTDPLPFLERM